jgi:GT2 family glycosyltransferase
LLLRRSLFQDLGGLNEVDFPVTFNDVDLCLRIRAQGLALVWTPFARLEHLESASRGRDEEPAQAWRARREQERLRARWCSLREVDPSYHPALAHDLWSGPYGALHLCPASRSPRVA